MQEAYCNDFPCPADLVCTAQLDMLVLLDGSGSVNWYGPGFEQERSFTKKLFELMSFGAEGAKARTFENPSFSRAVQPLLIESGVLLCLGQRLCLPPAKRRLFILHGILADCFVSTSGYVTKGRL